jgi:tetratricopeptide (TPR) repeat protein
VHDAWRIYQPVGYSSSAATLQIPPQAGVEKRFSAALDAFVSLEIGQQESALLAAAGKASSKSKPLNTLAVLYSRFGQYDRAEKTLKELLARDEYVPALINMGNIFFVRSQVDKALEYYNRASRKDPNAAVVLLCVARANHALENYAIAKKAYAQLRTVDPDLAQKFAYLDLRGEEATRAADADGVQKAVVWSE